MASLPLKSKQNQDYVTRGRDINGTTKSNTDSNDKVNLGLDQLRREFHKTLDLNYPIFGSTLIELDDFFHSGKGTCDDKIDNRWENKKRCSVEMETNHNRKSTNLDLNLKLSPPGVYLEDDSPNRSEISTPLSQHSSTSLDLSSSEVPSLILMGCISCRIYVMVSEVDPKCPKCQSSIFIDIFRKGPAKKSGKN